MSERDKGEKVQSTMLPSSTTTTTSSSATTTTTTLSVVMEEEDLQQQNEVSIIDNNNNNINDNNNNNNTYRNDHIDTDNNSVQQQHQQLEQQHCDDNNNNTDTNTTSHCCNSSLKRNNKVLYGVVFGRSIRMSFCSIHIARIPSSKVHNNNNNNNDNDDYNNNNNKNKKRTKRYQYQSPPCSNVNKNNSNNNTHCTIDNDLNNNDSNDDSDSDDDDDIDTDTETNSWNEQQQQQQQSPPPVVTLVRIQFSSSNTTTTNTTTELRSYFRRFIKNGDLLAIQYYTTSTTTAKTKILSKNEQDINKNNNGSNNNIHHTKNDTSTTRTTTTTTSSSLSLSQPEIYWQKHCPNNNNNIQNKNNDTTKNTTGTISIWDTQPRLVIHISNIDEAKSILRIEQPHFWSMRQYQEWQRMYTFKQNVHSNFMKITTTKAIPTNHSTTTTTTATSVDNNNNNNDCDTPIMKKSITCTSTQQQQQQSQHHDSSGLEKRTQGEYITNFLLNMIANKVLLEKKKHILVDEEVQQEHCLNYYSDPIKWAQQDIRDYLSIQDYESVLHILNTNLGVFDVAGGSGHVSMALGLHGIHSTVIDPREKAGKLPKRDRKYYHKRILKQQQQQQLEQSNPLQLNTSGITKENQSEETPALVYCQPVTTSVVPFDTIRAWFGTPPNGIDTSYRHRDQTIISVLDDQYIQKCSAIVALHPDEATDAIVDIAVQYRIPFVIVPCCVFHRLFPYRRILSFTNNMKTEVPVSTYNQLIEYLQYKDPTICTATLPFTGSNTVLFSTFV